MGGQEANLLSLLALVILVLDPSLMLLESVKDKMVESLSYNINASSAFKSKSPAYISLPCFRQRVTDDFAVKIYHSAGFYFF